MKINLKTFLGKIKTICLRKLLPGWRKSDGGKHETAFWRRWVYEKNTNPDSDYLFRKDPGRPLQIELTSLLPPGNKSPKILDVGCGPLSQVGIRFVGGAVKLYGADPLADEYTNILRDNKMQPNTTLIKCSGEELSACFGENNFDVVCAFNSLDHTISPIVVFREMVKVCKVGGYLYLLHSENEGLEERYSGMHQWNFQMVKNRLLVNDGRKSSELLQGSKLIKVHKTSRFKAQKKIFLEWVFQKL